MSIFEFEDNAAQHARMKVVGVGGGGGNAVNRMIEEHLEGVEFISVNTDAQALLNSKSDVKIQIGKKLTRGLGAGARPEIGRQAIEENRDEVARVLTNADLVFVTCGMGGGTGTGAAPVVAEVAKELGILTVAVVTKPFPFEGKKRRAVADKGMEELSQYVDSLITIPNERLLPVLGKDVSLISAFATANDVLLHAVQGIADLITRPGLINVDFADVRTVMSEMGMAMMGSGVSTGPNRAREAAERAIHSPLLDEINLQGARGILVNIAGGPDLAIGEFDEVGSVVNEFASEDAVVVTGLSIDPDLQDEVRVTVVATGLANQHKMSEAPIRLVHKRNTGEIDYGELEKPTSIRNKPKHEPRPDAKKEMDLEYLDIPAFLRRQAD
jgi:cell division protein FtsZ